MYLNIFLHRENRLYLVRQLNPSPVLFCFVYIDQLTAGKSLEPQPGGGAEEMGGVEGCKIHFVDYTLEQNRFFSHNFHLYIFYINHNLFCD